MKFIERFKKSFKFSFINNIGLFFILLSIVFLSYSYLIRIPFQSDRASLYPIVNEFKQSNHSTFWLSPDSYIIKYPVLMLILSVFGISIKSYFIFNLIQQISMWLILLAFYYVLYKKLKIYSNINFFITNIFLIFTFNLKLMDGMIYRNVEIAISFMYLLAIDWFINSNKEGIFSHLLIKILFLFSLSIFLYSDPFFSFTFFLPYSAYLLYKFLINSKGYKYLFSGILTGVSYLGSVLITKILEHLNFYVFNAHASFPTWSKFIENISYFINDILFMFNSDIFGLRFPSIRTLYMLINLLLLVISMYGLYLLYKSKNNNKNGALVFLPLVFLTNSIVFILKDNIEPNHLTIRYLVFIPFILITGLMYSLYKFKKNQIKLYVVIILMLIFSIATNTYLNKPNISKANFSKNIYKNYKLLAVLYRNNLNYGFSGYWNGLVNTVISENQIKIRAISCEKNKIIPFYFITNDGWYYSQKEAKNYFIILDNSVFLNGCDKSSLVNQFGQYDKYISFEDMNIFIWNKDITKEIPKYRPADVRIIFKDN